ncbi:uncharacterized protein LOC123408689 [Hordeum vulgare subsp. vulgare]|uniref:uncharacterized protein LOC123408689 n=1 Tax=Hordeum vulgare subsp. vulgare TaxID=112509 RepID=UPI001D1A3F27|nr:uncharacterized protein LOC123408689 [Hordeum vulgare subsp. vulgare]
MAWSKSKGRKATILKLDWGSRGLLSLESLMVKMPQQNLGSTMLRLKMIMLHLRWNLCLMPRMEKVKKVLPLRLLLLKNNRMERMLQQTPVVQMSPPPPRHAESVSVVLESEGSVEQSKGEEVVAEIKKPGTDRSTISGVTGQHDADRSVTTADPVINADEGNHEHDAITELVEQDGSNMHDHVHQIVDSCTSAPEIDVDGSKGLQIEALTTEPGVLDGSDCEATSKGPSEEEVVANGLGCAKDTADTSLELEG